MGLIRRGGWPSGLGTPCAIALLLGSWACSPEATDGGGEAAPAGGGSASGLTLAAPAASEEVAGSWHLGRAATEAEIAALDIDIMPDGRGLPEGSGDHTAGVSVVARVCAPCHGVAGEGTPLAGALVDADAETGFRRRVVGHFWPYSTTAFDYIRRAMPWDAPGTLTNDEVYAAVAWILAENGVIDRNAVMNAETLPAVVMPGRDRFVRDDRTDGPVVR